MRSAVNCLISWLTYTSSRDIGAYVGAYNIFLNPIGQGTLLCVIKEMVGRTVAAINKSGKLFVIQKAKFIVVAVYGCRHPVN